MNEEQAEKIKLFNSILCGVIKMHIAYIVDHKGLQKPPPWAKIVNDFFLSERAGKFFHNSTGSHSYSPRLCAAWSEAPKAEKVHFTYLL